ncbi:hypothetical protein HYH03_017678 [Edaphochlamys debaryana]|uniref:Peptidase M11 gametolysin domain-containing protein n=1 Tax=Edaphochlamys debaryana TaxID=47281 RepID=A0A835XGU6_9CHLO|nr:hypothetical protein HYH03_017678 [Edaphochlamys debaryana]|eukprot:KAG2483496.1 hypothetical protein HYH03_017678 [Edaphochlamys debaryana]
MPRKDKNGADVGLGFGLQLTCGSANAAGQCDFVSTTDVSVLAPPGPPAVPGAQPVSHNALFAYLDMSACGLPLDSDFVDPDTKQAKLALEQALFGPKRDGSGGQARALQQCSYGQYGLNPKGYNVAVVSVADSACAAVDACRVQELANLADEQVATALGSEWRSEFTRFVYILPKAAKDSGKCAWDSNAELPGERVWINSDALSSGRTFMLLHAMLHTEGLHHARQARDGELVERGVSGGSLDKDALPVGAVVAFDLPATYASGLGNHIRLVPDWLWPAGRPSSASINLYVDLRVAKPYTGDAAINDQASLGEDYVYADAFNIHMVLSVQDAAVRSRAAPGAERVVTFLSKLVKGERNVLSDYKLVLYWVFEETSPDAYQLVVCRYASSDGDCPGYAEAVTTASQAPVDVAGGPKRGRKPRSLKRLEGQLGVLTTHDDSDHDSLNWVISSADKGLVPLGKGFRPPKKDKDGNDLQGGAAIVMYCSDFGASIDTTTGSCTYVASSDVTMVSASSTKTVSNKITMLAMIVDFSACQSQYYPATLTPAGVKATFLGDKLDGSGGHAMHYEQCSYGALTLDSANFVALVVQLSGSNCTTDLVTIGNAADAAAGPQLTNLKKTLSSFSNRAYLLPAGMMGLYPGSAFAMLPGSQIWLFDNPDSFYRWPVVIQESMHSLMGRGWACPSAAELRYLGWATAVAGGDSLNQTGLAARTANTYILPAISLTGMGNFIRIKPDWLGAGWTKNIYLSVRVPEYGDALLDKEVVDGVTYSSKVAYAGSWVNTNKDMMSPISATVTPAIPAIPAIAPKAQGKQVVNCKSAGKVW